MTSCKRGYKRAKFLLSIIGRQQVQMRLINQDTAPSSSVFRNVDVHHKEYAKKNPKNNRLLGWKPPVLAGKIALPN